MPLVSQYLTRLRLQVFSDVEQLIVEVGDSGRVVGWVVLRHMERTTPV